MKKVSKKDIKRVEEYLSEDFVPETEYNLPDRLPFFYYVETDEFTIKWTCAYGPDNEVMSVYEMTPSRPGQAKEYQEMQLPDFETANKVRNKHVEDGWKSVSIPRVKFNNGERSYNRAERRKLAKAIVSGVLPIDEQKKSKPPQKPDPTPPPSWKYSDESDEES